jgi:hypothetical protein
MLVGSLVGSYGAISKASQHSSRAGRAAAWTIQPGEEALTAAVNRLPGASRVAQKFPNNRIDNEEIVIKGAKNAAKKAQPAVRAARRAKYDLKERATPEIRRFLASERGQADLTGSGRARGRADRGGQQVDVSDAPTYQDVEMELREEELSQTQAMLRDQADTKLSARRSQMSDVNTGGQVSRAQAQRALTMDPEEVVQARRRSTGGGSSRPYRGGSRTDQDAGMDFSGWSARRVEAETESEVAAEVEQSGGFGRLELTGFEQAMEDVQASVMAEAAQEQVPRQQATERQTSDLGAAWESEMEQAADLEGELALEGELEALFEQEFETETETAQEYEFESEYEQEYEYEFENEFEQEAKTENKTAQDVEKAMASGFGTWDKRYKNPIASAEEVMGWDE